MDNRIANDMISSGMIPSGEKKKEDLGRTQYGSAPSPSKLMDAYKSMYDKKDEVINEMKMGDVSGSADFASRNIKGAKGASRPKPGGIAKPKPPLPTPVEKDSSSPAPKTDSYKDQVMKKGFSKSYDKVGPKTQSDDMLDKVRDRRVEKAVNRNKDVRRATAKRIMTQYGESIDLLAAYRAVYEHHKKDADGNTIPHEGEEVKEGMGLYANIHAKRKRGGKMRKKGAKGAPSSQDFANAAKTAKEESDLFDVIVTHFIDEGYEEKEVYKAMANLTEDQLQNLHEVLPALGAIGAALKSGAVASKVGAVAGKVGAFASKAGSVASKGLASAGKAIPTSIKNVGKTIKGNVSSGLNKPFNPRVTQGPKPAPMQGPRQANFGDKLKNIGRGVKDFYKSKDVGMGNKVLATSLAVDTVGRLGGAMRPRGLQKSDTDLFDIVKGQLLDEGLSEEEIKDIMLTLTPDEIMSEMAVNPNIAAMDAKNKADMIARAQANKVPDKVREASKRQMKAGTPREDKNNPYTTQDKKTIIDYNKNK